MAKAWRPLPRVIQWSNLCDKWEGPTACPTALALATIQQESGGQPSVTRYEPEYEKNYVIGNSKNMAIARQCNMGTKQVSTSYGLMQLMFPLAYGYGARSIEALLDPNQNIRFGMAHLGVLIRKYLRVHGGGEIDAACIRSVAGSFNGAGAASAYARNVSFLFDNYTRFLRGEL